MGFLTHNPVGHGRSRIIGNPSTNPQIDWPSEHAKTGKPGRLSRLRKISGEQVFCCLSRADSPAIDSLRPRNPAEYLHWTDSRGSAQTVFSPEKIVVSQVRKDSEQF
jgi:hypothetical protein